MPEKPEVTERGRDMTETDEHIALTVDETAELLGQQAITVLNEVIQELAPAISPTPTAQLSDLVRFVQRYCSSGAISAGYDRLLAIARQEMKALEIEWQKKLRIDGQASGEKSDRQKRLEGIAQQGAYQSWLDWVVPSEPTDIPSMLVNPSTSLQQEILAWALPYAHLIDAICAKTELDFPFTPLLKDWLAHRPIDPEARPGKILASSLIKARPVQAKLLMPKDTAPPLGHQPARTQPVLPGFEAPPGAVVPVLPLWVAERNSVGGAAAVTPRLWFGCQMALPWKTGRAGTPACALP